MQELLTFNRDRGKGALIAAIAVLAFALLGSLLGAPGARANGVVLNKEDVLAGIGSGITKHFNAKGELLDELNNGTASTFDTGMCFDAAVNLYTTNFSGMSKFDGNGNLLVSTFGSGFNEHPESCIVSRAQNVYVGQADGSTEVLEFNANGEHLASFMPNPESRGTDWVDLASNQCTLRYTSEGNQIRSYDVCTKTQLPVFATGLPGPCYANRILADGGELVACTTVVERINAKGEVTQTFEPKLKGGAAPTLLFALNIDPDGETFWTGDLPSGEIWRINIATGEVATTFNAGINTALGGLAVIGERTCAQAEIKLVPTFAEHVQGTNHTVTATVAECGGITPGATVTFNVSGANAQTGSAVSNGAGEATFSYTGALAGTDHIVASFVNQLGETETSNEVTAVWTPAEDPQISAVGQSVSGTEGEAVSAAVANFTDPDGAAVAGEYSAMIKWGDGAESPGTVTGSGGHFSVSGSHTYADEKEYAVSVAVADSDNSSNTATSRSRASIADGSLSASGLEATSPPAFSGTVATLKDANQATSSAGDFSATINWGDGTPVSGGTVSGAGGSYAVSGSHAYKSTGYFTVKVHVVDDGGSTADATSRVLVFAVAGGGNFVIGDNSAAVGAGVTFWGAKWWKLNSLSSGSGPASFKGFAEAPAMPVCGRSWSADPGNSTPPPAGPLPAYMAVIVTSSVSKSGPTITGDTAHVVVVKTNAGYAPNPGHAGTGIVVTTIC
jgi:hypothetical protein